MTICFPRLLLQCSLPPVGYKDSQLPLTFVNTCYFQMSCAFAHFIGCVLSFCFVSSYLPVSFYEREVLIKQPADLFVFSSSFTLLSWSSGSRMAWTGLFLFVHRQCGIETKQTDFTLETGNAELTTSSCTENPALRLKREKCLREISEQKDYKWRKR